jgi:hypothetical protein
VIGQTGSLLATPHCRASASNARHLAEWSAIFRSIAASMPAAGVRLSVRACFGAGEQLAHIRQREDQRLRPAQGPG